jgi:hypothetical protein
MQHATRNTQRGQVAATCNTQRATRAGCGNMQHATRNTQHGQVAATCNMQHATWAGCGNMQHATRNMGRLRQHATRNTQHATRNTQRGQVEVTCNSQHATCNMQHATRAGCDSCCRGRPAATHRTRPHATMRRSGTRPKRGSPRLAVRVALRLNVRPRCNIRRLVATDYDNSQPIGPILQPTALRRCRRPQTSPAAR